jgi:acid phosphatase class B
VSDVCWTRTTVGGPNYLGGSVTTTLSKSPKEAKMASVADVAGAIGGVAPLTVENFDLDDVEMFANSPLMVPLLSEFFYTR